MNLIRTREIIRDDTLHVSYRTGCYQGPIPDLQHLYNRINKIIPIDSGGDFCILSYNDPLDFSKNAVVDLRTVLCYSSIKQGTDAKSSERSNDYGNEYRKQNP